jgi:NTE family protein
MARKPTPTAKAVAPRHEHHVLLLQGGGALGAFQAGAYEGIDELGVPIDWVCGVSIGAINAALIAGNPPERRVQRLHDFWQRVSAAAPFVAPAGFETLRPLMNRMAASSATVFGIPGFFTPRPPALNALSVYDTAPLKATLLELCDFDLINHKSVRLSVGAVNVRSGNSVYFDNHRTHITPEHIMASGALPPGFPPVVIDGESYWDGGIVSNSPLWYVLDTAPGLNALIMQIDLFSARGPLPDNLDQVQERAKDIQYSSKTRFNSTQVHQREQLRAAFRRLAEKLPASLRDDPDVRTLSLAARPSTISLLHLINRHNTGSSSVKDYEFSRATVNELWAAGLNDVRHAHEHIDWGRATSQAEGMRVFDLTRH